ncbi:hypothetical protein [Streptomyces griseus]|uniref:hypothetical protein n=1 Tax=Streptomyces griseus TaxID=1911 RepID=UPI00131C1D38|nr:hypothetical protein [Streptomyces griseus]
MAAQPVTHETPCAMMRREAKSARTEIRSLGKQISHLDQEIAELGGQPDPDQQAIAALKQRRDSLRVKLEQDELSLQTLEDVISENC